MSDNFCEFCGKSFSSVYNLRVHINTAKYCLADRKESGIGYKCDYCECKLTRKSALSSHQNICIKYKDYIIETKDKEIVALNEKNTKRIQELETKHKKELEELKTKITKLEETITYGKGYVEGCKTVKPSKITNNTHNTLVQKFSADSYIIQIITFNIFCIYLLQPASKTCSIFFVFPGTPLPGLARGTTHTSADLRCSLHVFNAAGDHR
jgi:hypothetical protein